jgi:hypothetical protein
MTREEAIEAMARTLFSIANDDDEWTWEDYADPARAALDAARPWVEGLVREMYWAAVNNYVDSRAGKDVEDIDAIVARVMEGKVMSTGYGTATAISAEWYALEVQRLTAALAAERERVAQLNWLLSMANEYTRHPDYDWPLDFSRDVIAALNVK